MKHKDTEFNTIDKVGFLDYKDDELTLFVKLKDIIKEYNAIELLNKMVGTTVQFKSVSDDNEE